ncbi:hypothetical protein Leryth_013332 [Lithospermum erythrorhizon]|nr:hypothetical protein Leryth_013332 [Lithospermum erythrorhizon]
MYVERLQTLDIGKPICENKVKTQQKREPRIWSSQARYGRLGRWPVRKPMNRGVADVAPWKLRRGWKPSGFFCLSSLIAKKDQEGASSIGMKSFRFFALLGAAQTIPAHSGILSSYDHASIRRGYQVYQEVYASCHSMSLISYRDLVDVAYTEEETKAMAAEIEVVDGPNDEGEMFTRPGKLSDRLPQPYANEQAARLANGGAYPPDLSLITKARHNGQNYVFALLTGYRDPPAGVSIREGLHYNLYFPGGAIAMPKMLNDGAVEYEDGTPGTEAQMGKEVVPFLSWAAEPEMEERKLMGSKWIFVLSLALLQAAYYRRLRWSVLKSRKLKKKIYYILTVFHVVVELIDLQAVHY